MRVQLGFLRVGSIRYTFCPAGEYGDRLRRAGGAVAYQAGSRTAVGR